MGKRNLSVKTIDFNQIEKKTLNSSCIQQPARGEKKCQTNPREANESASLIINGIM